MESVFDSLEVKYWDDDLTQIKKLSPYCTKSFEFKSRKLRQWVKRSYSIAIDHIIQLDETGNPKKYSKTRFKLFQPFIEESIDNPLFGFRLGQKEFYVESSSVLDEVIEQLSKFCILDSFEEDFAVIKQIGRGSTSTVHLLEELESHSQYAGKCIKKTHLQSRPTSLANLHNEISILFELDHSSIVKLHQVYETTDFIYLILDYLPHGDLYKRISQKKFFSEEDSAKFTRNLLEVLDYIHSKDIVHRDLKLENIMMTDDNDFNFKIIDFGLASRCLSGLFGKCGSPGYIAPEILQDKSYNTKVDIFSAGVLVYITMTGAHPFNASSTSKILEKNSKCSFKVEGLLKGYARDFIRFMITAEPDSRMDAWQLLEQPWLGNCRRGSVCGAFASCSTVAGSIAFIN
jgi:hypothetical protein